MKPTIILESAATITELRDKVNAVLSTCPDGAVVVNFRVERENTGGSAFFMATGSVNPPALAQATTKKPPVKKMPASKPAKKSAGKR